MNKRTVGTFYEEQACEYLLKQGYLILDRNFRCSVGEIDIIARDARYLVFIEVKFRTSSVYGYASEAVTPSKRKRLIAAARYYLYKKHFPSDMPCRFDVVSIHKQQINIIKDAFELA